MSIFGGNMDDLLPKLLVFPPHPPPAIPLSDAQYEDGIKSQISYVSRLSDKQLMAQTSGGEGPLDVINPALNTVPYVYILLAHLQAANKGHKGLSWEDLFEKMVNFAETFDSRQIRYLGKEFSAIIDHLSSIARSSRQPIIAIAPIRTALLRLDPSGSILTSTHLNLVKLALEAHEYESVLPVLDKCIFYFPGVKDYPKPKYVCDLNLTSTAYITPESKLTQKLKYQEVLEYFLYSGMVYMALGRWECALECFENAVTYPSREVSKIMIEAYKKWLLVGIILEGKPLQLPRSTSNIAAKAYHILAKPYDSLAQLFETATAQRFKAEVDVAQKIWQQDCNMGLILHVMSAFQKFQIRKLADVYSKITIPEVHKLTESAESGNKTPIVQQTEQLVLSMIQEGSLNATLTNPTSGAAILTFSSGPVLSEDQMQNELRASKQRIQVLTKEIIDTDKNLTYDKEYIKYVQKQKKNAKAGLVDQGIVGQDMDWSAIEDEELMTGVF